MDPIYRHIAACNNATIPGGRPPVFLAGQLVGYLDPRLQPDLLRLGGVTPCVVTPGAVTASAGAVDIDPAALEPITRTLAAAGYYRWRSEAFDVRATPDGPVLATIDRGALPAFGIQAAGVHLNALVQGEGGLFLWVARRAANKLLDPGKLDHLVAGGIPAGYMPAEALEKEAEEEASLPPPLLRDAAHVATIDYAMQRPEGLRRDRLYCYDVVLPASFVPEPRDGEVEAFELWPIADVLARARGTDDFKFNVNLVLIDLFQRLGLLDPAPPP